MGLEAIILIKEYSNNKEYLVLHGKSNKRIFFKAEKKHFKKMCACKHTHCYNGDSYVHTIIR